MIHIVEFIERRFPEESGTVIRALTLVSLMGLAAGIGLILRSGHCPVLARQGVSGAGVF